jgi:5-methylcytosine-specific restriction endonuclease McrA
MNYQKIYNDLVFSRQMLNRKVPIEKHHIVPKCLGGNDDLSNLVKLTFREHLIAHRLLTRIYPKHRGLAGAVAIMIGTKAKADERARLKATA